MARHKNARTRGRFSLARYFRAFKEGDRAAVVRELSIPFAYSKRLQGRTGKIIAKRGAAYDIEIPDLGKPKRYCIHPIHLRKIEAKAA